MLASSLNGNPNIICFRELFNPLMDGIGFHVEGYDNGSKEDLELRNRDFREFLERRVFCDHASATASVGFKAPYAHLRLFKALQEWLVDDTEIQVIHLKRRNLLRMFVSLEIARKTGGWAEDRKRTLRSKFRLSNVPGTARHPLRTMKRLYKFFRPPEPEWKSRRVPLALTRQQCVDFFEETNRDAAYFEYRFRNHPILTVHYEDLLDNRTQTLARVQSFLGVNSRRLEPTTRRQNPEPLHELIDNYDELRAEFRDTPQAAFFA